MVMNSFKALLIEERDGKVSSGLVRMDESQLDAGGVTIRVAYSSINYKDALAATGAGKIIRRFPCIGGIDMSGTVIESTDPRFKPGDRVVASILAWRITVATLKSLVCLPTGLCLCRPA